MTGSLVYGKPIPYPAVFERIAHDIASARQLLNEKRRNDNPQFDFGALNFEAEKLGIVGELIARQVMEDIGKPYKATLLVAPHPLREPDIICDGNRFNVKAMPTRREELFVNEGKRKKEAGDITHYWFLRLLPDHHVEGFIYAADEVATWPLTTSEHHPEWGERRTKNVGPAPFNRIGMSPDEDEQIELHF